MSKRISEFDKFKNLKIKYNKKPYYFIKEKIKELLQITQKLNLDNTNKRLIRLYSLLKTIINEGLK